MNRKNIIGLILTGFLVTLSLFIGVDLMIGRETNANYNQEINQTEDEDEDGNDSVSNENGTHDEKQEDLYTIDLEKEEPWLASNPSDEGRDPELPNASDEVRNPEQLHPDQEDPIATADIEEADIEEADIDGGISNNDITEDNTDTDLDHSTIDQAQNQESKQEDTEHIVDEENSSEQESKDTIVQSSAIPDGMELIYDSSKVDYLSYIPETVYDSKIETALDIANPKIDVNATAAMLFDAKTGEVLYYKNPIEAVFPASTVKLLTSLIALEWCLENEEVVVGEEVEKIPSDSSKANIRKGQVHTIQSLLAAMLLPSGNDAAYATATYVGRKSLQDPGATWEEALLEFSRLMNQKAKQLGAINSLFITPDGYDAIGQYTTAYDMGLIGLAALKNDTIVEISKKSNSRNVLVSGEDITWKTTNSLIVPGSARYYSYAIGLKTGTSTMAGRCLISAGRKDGKEVLAVVMDSSSSGRWSDSIKLLKYGLESR